MTHDEFEALPTAEKIAIREKDLEDARRNLAHFASEAAYHRSIADRYAREADGWGGMAGAYFLQLAQLRTALEAEKSAARAAKRKKSDAAPEPQPVTENPE